MDPSTTEDSPKTPIAADTSAFITPSPDSKQEQHHGTATETAQSLQSTAQQLTDQALQFLSTASNETLGACLVGIGATTYFVLGRVGLVLMGVVGGVVLHATWEGSVSAEGTAISKSVEERRRKEVGVEVVSRILGWRARKGQDEEKEDEEDVKVVVQGQKRLGFEGFRPETERALNELTEAVIRDYVK